MRIVVGAERRTRVRLPQLVSFAEPGEGLHRTQEGVLGRTVTDHFAPDGILLVGEFEARKLDLALRVIQRCVEGGVDSVVDGEVDVSHAEGLRARVSVGIGGFAVFRWSEEEEEGDDDEVEGALVEGAKFSRLLQRGRDVADDGDVDRVGVVRGAVFALEALEKSTE